MTSLLKPFLVVEMAGPEAPLAHRLAIGIAGRIAADLGARVIKIVPPEGDPIVRTPVVPHERSDNAVALSAVIDASKTLLPLDLQSADGQADRDRLLALASGLLTDAHRPFSGETKRRVDVAVRVLPTDDLLAKNDPSELTVLALSGLLDLIGDPQRAPLAFGGHQVAYASGFAAFTALMGGLASNSSRRLDIDLLDVMVWINWKGVGTPAFRPGANLSREGRRAEWQVLPCADGHIALVHSEKDWRPLAELIGHPDLLDPELTSLLGREKHRERYIPIIAAWVAARSREEIYRAAQSRGIPIGPVVLPGEFGGDPQFAARNVVGSFDYEGRTINLPRLPIRWNGASFEARAPRHAKSLQEALG